MVTPMAMAMNRTLIAQCDETNIAQYSSVAHSVNTDTTLIRIGTALCLAKLLMYVPRLGWFISQSYNLLLPRRKSAEARRRKGVVGSTGMNAPRIPNPSAITPNKVRILAIRSVS